MKQVPTLGAALLVSALYPSVASAQTIACASEASPARGGQWYYRIIDERKCWYQGKAMMPKTSLYWPKSSTADAQSTIAGPEATTAGKPDAKPETDGRSAAAPISAKPAAWPTPVVNEISFESRWLGLRSRN